MIGKKFLAFSLTAAILAGSAMSASAAGLSDVFDATTYAGKYSDLKNIYGTDASKLIEHFKAFGSKEGRVISPVLDVVAYRNAYADLNAAFGDNWDAYVDHYLTSGIKEKRTAGVLFDLVDYANKNADVKKAYGEDYVAIAKHYVNYGIRENRPGGTVAQAAAPAASSSNNNSTPSTPSTPSTSTPSTSTPNTSTTTPSGGSNASSAEDHVTNLTTTHVHLKSELKSHLEPTCESEGYNEWICKAPVLWNHYNDKGELIGVENAKDANGNDIFCNTQWQEKLGVQHVEPSSADDPNVHWVHPTCFSEGVRAYTCQRCGEYVTMKLDKLEHDFFDPQTVVKYVESKSCKVEDQGYKRIKCRNCDTTKDIPLPLLPHQIGAARIVKEAATCASTGIAMGYCNYCKAEVEEIIPKTTHNAAHIKNRTVYADSYTVEDADQNEGLTTANQIPRTHIEYSITYCTDCNVVITSSQTTPELTGKVACTDVNKDGSCDYCKLPMDRTGKNQIKFYQEGQLYNGDVQ